MVIVSSRSKRRVYAPIGTTGRLARIYPIRLSCFARPCAVRKLELAFPRALRLGRQHQLADRLRRLHPAGIGIRSSTRATTVTYLGATRALPLQPRNVRRGSLAADPLSGSAARGRLVKPRGVRKFTAFDGQQRLGTPAAAPIMARRLIAMNIRVAAAIGALVALLKFLGHPPYGARGRVLVRNAGGHKFMYPRGGSMYTEVQPGAWFLGKPGCRSSLVFSNASERIVLESQTLLQCGRVVLRVYSCMGQSRTPQRTSHFFWALQRIRSCSSGRILSR